MNASESLRTFVGVVSSHPLLARLFFASLEMAESTRNSTIPILGISEAAQTISFEEMSDRQQRLARAIKADP